MEEMGEKSYLDQGIDYSKIKNFSSITQAVDKMQVIHLPLQTKEINKIE